MLSLYVLYSACLLTVSAVLLFVAGHRTNVGHWLASLFTMAASAGAAWVMQVLVMEQAPPLGWVVALVLVTGAFVTAIFEDWNAIAHATFTASALAAITFVVYAGHVLFAAQLGPWSFAFGVILLLLQSTALLFFIAQTFEILDVVTRTRWRRIFGPRIVANYWPKISVNVPTHNEPPEIVIDTLNALARLEYPNFEVLVIDNNTADERLWRPLEDHCKRLGPRFSFTHLMPWPGYKSGALNWALAHLSPDVEIISVVDADYLVEPTYLKELVGHFADPKVAFVQTPQDYRDRDVGGRYSRALYLSYEYFFKISMPSRNERNAIIFAGTMGLIRRRALEEVGGWDEWCITEDAEVSLRLLHAGYESVYVERTYGRGLMPLDYAALKKQRYRWAFGGMQILRMHARALAGGRRGHLTWAQRFAYLSGGLQWLNDPLSVVFTIILLIAATAVILGGSIFVQPLVGATLLVPPLLILYAVLRFLWAFRVRVQCTWREAGDSLVVLLGLSWVVTLACISGLFSRQGVFLRTPKQSDRPRLTDAVRVVRFETALATLCLSALVGVLMQFSEQPLSARTVLIGLLVWQTYLYLSASRTSFWNYAARAGIQPPRRAAFETSGYGPGFLESERRRAAWVGMGGAVLALLFYIAVLLAPVREQIWRTDPFGEFLPAGSLLPRRSQDVAAAILVREADAVERQDLERALALWDPHGTIVDYNFTLQDAADDRAWRGGDAVRARYEEEFAQRRYKRLRHRNLSITEVGDEAVIVGDLDALINVDDADERIVYLPQSDRWTLSRRSGVWRIIRLEVNRASVPPGDEPARDHRAGRSKG